MLWLYYKKTDGQFDCIMGVITMKIPYLQYILFIKKKLEQKRLLKAFLIIQRQVPFINKRLPIFVLHTILKTLFSKIKIFIINNINLNNKT